MTSARPGCGRLWSRGTRSYPLRDLFRRCLDSRIKVYRNPQQGPPRAHKVPYYFPIVASLKYSTAQDLRCNRDLHLACYSSNALKTAAVNAVVVFLANCYRYVFASVFPEVHGAISEAQWPNDHVLIVAKHVLRKITH